MKRILVPTDFSTCADNAINFAVQSAKLLPIEVIIIHSYEINSNMYVDYIGVNKAYNQTLVNDYTNKLADLKKSILETEGIKVTTRLYTDSIEDSILKATEENQIDLIVMGTLGASGLKEKLWGSKTAGIIGKTRVPVLAIPFEYQWKKPGKMLLAINQFEDEPGMLDFPFEMADQYKAQVIITVFTDDDDDDEITVLNRTHEISAYEKLLNQTYNKDSITVTHIVGKEFEETLQEYIKQSGIDIVTMVTYQKTFLESIFHSSKTKRMAYHTTIPLLAIPAKEK